MQNKKELGEFYATELDLCETEIEVAELIATMSDSNLWTSPTQPLSTTVEPEEQTILKSFSPSLDYSAYPNPNLQRPKRASFHSQWLHDSAAALPSYVSHRPPQAPPPQFFPYRESLETNPEANRGKAPQMHSPTTFYAYRENLETGPESIRGKSQQTRRQVTSPSGESCSNCGVETSTLWRNCVLLDGSKYLCNACGLRYKKGKYCPLCFKVYYDVDTNLLQWKQCRTCLNWTHQACLIRHSIELTDYECASCKNKAKTLSSPS
jgi:hypothetical protein